MSKINVKKPIFIWDFLCLALLNVIDRLTKLGAAYYCENENYIVLDEILEFTYMKNYGGALGILNNQRFFFIFICPLFKLSISILFEI